MSDGQEQEHDQEHGDDGGRGGVGTAVTRCEWCGVVLQQRGVGRRSRYCGQSHRQAAYAQRRTDEAVAAAVAADRAARGGTAPA